jgi:hypothetical protein
LSLLAAPATLAASGRCIKHFCARGRIALSGVDLRPPGPGGVEKNVFPRIGGVKAPQTSKVKESRAHMARS